MGSCCRGSSILMGQRTRRFLFLLGSSFGICSFACERSAVVLESEPPGVGGGGMLQLGGAGGVLPESGGGSVAVGTRAFEGEFSALDAGDAHTCAVLDRELFCWGDNATGALGVDSATSSERPVRVQADREFSSVSAGASFTCARDVGGAVWCFGRGTNGQIGNGQFSDVQVPTRVTLGEAAESVSSGHGHACAVLESGGLECWGGNAEGQLAQDDPFPSPGTPSALPLPVPAIGPVRSVSAGQGHTCAIDEAGALWCWGRNARNELGLGDAADDQLRFPNRVGTDSDWTSVSAGQNHTCGLRASGSVYCWGANGGGQLGTGDRDDRDVPTAVPGLEGQVSLVTDTFHTCSLSAAGQVACWGRGTEGQLGVGDSAEHLTPLAVESAGIARALAIGRFHTCALGESTVLVTGANTSGQLGLGDALRRSRFEPIPVALDP
jgi:alpha-tubulin suppressor-like RCC1 family protein